MPEPDPTIAERAREARLTIARHLADLHRLHLVLAEDSRALTAAACTELPPAIGNWPWGRIEDPRWNELSPTAAAAAIAARLGERCAYDLNAPQGASEPLATSPPLTVSLTADGFFQLNAEVAAQMYSLAHEGRGDAPRADFL